MSKLPLALRLQGKIAGFGRAREQGRPSGAGVACDPMQFLSSVQLGLPSAGARLYFLGGGEQRWIVHLLDISGNIGKDSNHFDKDYRRNCYYIYNDYLWRSGSKAYRAALSRAGFCMARRSMVWVASTAKSFVRLLSFSTHVILTLLRISDFSRAAMTEEVAAAGLEQGRQPGLIEVPEHQEA